MPLTFWACTRTLSPSTRTCAPSHVRIWHMNLTSLRFGTRRMTQGSAVSNVAARIGSTAFLAPLTATSPCSGTPPLINKLSMDDSSSPHSGLRFSFHDRDSRTTSIILVECFHNPLLSLEHFADGFGLAVSEFEHESAAGFEKRSSLSGHSPEKVQAIRAAIQREPRFVPAHLRL